MIDHSYKFLSLVIFSLFLIHAAYASHSSDDESSSVQFFDTTGRKINLGSDGQPVRKDKPLPPLPRQSNNDLRDSSSQMPDEEDLNSLISGLKGEMNPTSKAGSNYLSLRETHGDAEEDSSEEHKESKVALGEPIKKAMSLFNLARVSGGVIVGEKDKGCPALTGSSNFILPDEKSGN